MENTHGRIAVDLVPQSSPRTSRVRRRCQGSGIEVAGDGARGSGSVKLVPNLSNPGSRIEVAGSGGRWSGDEPQVRRRSPNEKGKKTTDFDFDFDFDFFFFFFIKNGV